MKVLFVPMPEGGPAHLIPLLALNRMVKDPSVETAFLLRRSHHELIRQLGVNVLGIDHRNFTDNGFRTELRAYRVFSPDVVVDDASLTTGYATAFANLPRIAIQRTGMFPGDKARNPSHGHSIKFLGDFKDLPDVSFLGLRQHQTFADFFKAKTKIVPGIPSLEVLPEELQDDPSYNFAGPLLLDDLLISQFGQLQPGSLDLDALKRFDPLAEFFEKHRGRRVVYLTFGTMAQASAPIFESIRHLLDEDIAVVSSIKPEGLDARQQELYYFGSYLPMHLICSNVDLMIHQCGSGTYHYPILHNVPAVTIGTQCFDREHVALRLEECGVSVHLPAPNECEDFVKLFKDTVAKYFDATGAFMAEKKRRLAALNEKIEQTSAAFDFESVLRKTVAR